ncbi:hypothetical protein AB0N05_15530 [Nocardia sp. NPDC051030]|uniref:hypothetical protein n=1 Tax=Nocardia sp. NPDC051030 TaxID=3155162 RepID=UPI0034185C3E
MQFYGLVLYPHLVQDAYATRISPAMAQKLIAGGIDMLITYYGKPGKTATGR